MKYMYILLLVSGFVIADDKAANYQDIHSSFTGASCLKSKNQYEYDSCTQKSLDSSILEMKKLINKLISNKEDDSFITDFNHAQKVWEQHKIATCNIQTHDSKGGSGFSSILNNCLETETNERISFINWFIDNP